MDKKGFIKVEIGYCGLKWYYKFIFMVQISHIHEQDIVI